LEENKGRFPVRFKLRNFRKIEMRAAGWALCVRG
jgi:hypothetical protein